MHNLSAEDKNSLLSWYEIHQRDLPWRFSKDPWEVLLSEILLQQTQMTRGLEYWKSIIKRFPTPKDMSIADVDEVLYFWQGAGYYARARRLHECAVRIVSEHGGHVPSDYDQLLDLPGIGPYTAAAVSSIAFGGEYACADGNIRRVMSRYNAIEDVRPNDVQSWASDQLEPRCPGDWNQAMMELGALICTPKSPRCSECPLLMSCRGKEEPTKYPRPKTRQTVQMTLHAIIEMGNDGNPRLYKRPEVGLFGGMWGPILRPEGTIFDGIKKVGTIHHTLTHKEITVVVYVQSFDGNGQLPSAFPLSVMDKKILNVAGVDI